MSNLSRRELIASIGASAFTFNGRAVAQEYADTTEDFRRISQTYPWLDNARFSVGLLSGKAENGTAIHLGHGLHIFDTHVARDNNNIMDIKYAGQFNAASVSVKQGNVYQDIMFGRINSDFVSPWNLKRAVFAPEIDYAKDATTILVGWHNKRLDACLGKGVYPFAEYQAREANGVSMASVASICNAETHAFAKPGFSGGWVCGEDGQIIGVIKASGPAQTPNGQIYITTFTPCDAVIEAAHALFAPPQSQTAGSVQDSRPLPAECKFIAGRNGWQSAAAIP